MYNAEGVFELQNYHNQDLMLDPMLKLGSKMPLKKLRKVKNLSLSLRREP